MQELLQHVEWAGPSGGVVLVRDNDLYYSPPPGTGPVLQLTRTGVPGVVFNGVTDWLYRGQSCSRIQRTCTWELKPALKWG